MLRAPALAAMGGGAGTAVRCLRNISGAFIGVVGSDITLGGLARAGGLTLSCILLAMYSLPYITL